MESTVLSVSPQETFNLGKKIGESLQGGEVICLYGDLGAGKTVLAKGLGRGLGVEAEITSPTFTLIQEYESPSKGLRFIHMDLYRLTSPEEAEIIGVTDYFQDDCVCLLEWPEIIEDLLPPDHWQVRIEGSGDLPRHIRLLAAKQGEKINENLNIVYRDN
ncbi:MAG: tRNA (adenosine(37)-N6)-threonylcarbamoyltransferase complex ATPase subunit type 1 TsaE [Peptococcaceae bacterium]|nr:tRNA (adenosine(37)-N6)-threonylcarbamoyltransferase complex ATPase subunit type 1 TsaE [Peptococcaceae bacterium]